MKRHVVILSALAAFAIAGCGPGTAEKPTSVVLIVVDTLRPDHLGCYGNDGVETPNIDALAGGVRFESAVSPVPLTLPAVASIVTGRTPLEHGVHYGEGYRLPDAEITLAEVLAGQGFRTAAFVGAAVLDPAFGVGQGFEVYDAAFPDKFQLFNASLRPLESVFNGTQRRAAAVTRAASEWVEKNGDGPFLLMLHLYDPHTPCDPPPPFVPEVEGEGTYEDLEKQQVIQYDAEIQYTDHEIGLFVDGLRERGLLDRTLVVLTSDHGEGMGEKGEDSHGVFLYDSTLRVPLIFGGATGSRRGRVVTEQARLVDIFPTILDMLGIAAPEGISGRSLRPLIEGGPGWEPQPAYLETYASRIERGWSVLKGIRTDEWKYVRAPEPELYRLSDDPGESRNLFSEARETADRMEGLLAAMEAAAGTVERVAPEITDPSLVERVRSLGYVGADGDAPDLDFADETGPDPKSVFPAFRNERYAQEYTRLALLFVPGGQLAGARYFLEKAVELQPDNPQVHFYLSEVFRMQGLTTKAREEIDRTVALDPENADAYYQRGLVASQAGDVDAALASFQRAVELKPDHDQAYNNMGLIYGQREDYDRALRMFEKALAINPDLPQAHINVGNVRFARREYDAACRSWEIALKLDPTQKNLHAALGNAYSQAGKYEKALAHYETFVVDNPDSFTVRRIQGAMETIRERMAGASPPPE